VQALPQTTPARPTWSDASRRMPVLALPAVLSLAAAALLVASPPVLAQTGAADRLGRLSTAQPAEPVLRAYAGAAVAMRAQTTMLPWRKMSHAEDGLALIDKALSQLGPADEAPRPRGVPGVLEARFVAANTFLGLPAMFNRGECGRSQLDAVLGHPLFDNAPAPFKAVVWLRAGEMLALTGSSGSGKSTLLHIAGLIDRADAGELRLRGQDVTTMPEAQATRLRRDAFGFVFQGFNLVPVMTVWNNVDYALFIAGVPVPQRRQPVQAMLDAVGLAAHTGHRPDALSGGQRQRVAIARALVKQPALVIAGEPTANLDSHTADQVLDLMRDSGCWAASGPADPIRACWPRPGTTAMHRPTTTGAAGARAPRRWLPPTCAATAPMSAWPGSPPTGRCRWTLCSTQPTAAASSALPRNGAATAGGWTPACAPTAGRPRPCLRNCHNAAAWCWPRPSASDPYGRTTT